MRSRGPMQATSGDEAGGKQGDGADGRQGTAGRGRRLCVRYASPMRLCVTQDLEALPAPPAADRAPSTSCGRASS